MQNSSGRKTFNKPNLNLFSFSFLFLQMVVMDEVHKQMGEIASKQKERIDEMGAEIRKLKAMIVKHESRIRTLETKNRDLESGGGGGLTNQAATAANSSSNGNGANGSDEEIMGPDEV